MPTWPTDGQINTAFPDNNTGAISAADLRNHELAMAAAGRASNVQQAASDPAGAVAGDQYWNTTDNTLYVYNGTAWEPAVPATGGGSGDMTKAVYDTNDDGKVDSADAADAAPWSGLTGVPSTFPPSAHNHPISEVTGLQTELDTKAPLNNPAFAGAPTAPSPPVDDSTTRIATTEWVQGEIGDAGGGDMLKSVYDTNDDGKVDAADSADAAPWSGLTGVPADFPPSSHTHPISEVTNLQTELDGKAASSHTHTVSDITDNETLVQTAFAGGITIEVVASLPGTPDANTLYLVTG